MIITFESQTFIIHPSLLEQFCVEIWNQTIYYNNNPSVNTRQNVKSKTTDHSGLIQLVHKSNCTAIVFIFFEPILVDCQVSRCAVTIPRICEGSRNCSSQLTLTGRTVDGSRRFWVETALLILPLEEGGEGVFTKYDWWCSLLLMLP